MKSKRLIITLLSLITLAGCAEKVIENAPILIVANKDNFGLYTREILDTEGFKEYKLITSGTEALTKENLKNVDLVIFTSGNINGRLAVQLASYVSNGGNLVLLRPDTSLSKMAGIKYRGSGISEGYFKLNQDTGIGTGMQAGTIQFHGYADCYLLDGAEEIARLYSSDELDTGYPAVTVYAYGKGKVACFMFNLPQSVVYLHQGNPKWKNQERDGVLGLRNLDLFAGIGNEKDWIDKNKVVVPQADEQVRLFSHVIEDLTSGKKPLPRLWYFSGHDKCVALLTVDGENNGDLDFYQEEIQSELDVVNSRGGHMTVYLIGTGIRPDIINAWKNRGNEIGIHFDDSKNATRVTRENMDSTITTMQKQFREAYGDGFSLLTARNHWIVWYGWAEQAEIELEHGVRLDCNSYKYDNSKDVSRPDWIGGFGYYTGSGIPMKFADEKGNVLDIYQSETSIVDEQLNTKGGIFNGYKTLVNRSLYEEKYAVVNAVFHPNSNSNRPYLDELKKTADYCRDNQVPMWTGRELIGFIQARDSVRFNVIKWSGNRLEFKINAPVNPGRNLTLMIPYQYGKKNVSAISINGIASEYVRLTVKGREYAFVVFQPGKILNVSANYH